MPVLSLIADPRSYHACEWDLTDDAAGRAYWLNLFRTHIHSIARPIRAELGPGGDGRIAAFLADYLEGLRILDTKPDAWGRLTVLKLTEYRQELQKRHGFFDPFAHIKAKENQKAIELYPRVVADLDRLTAELRMEALARGIFAGNEFDLGSEATTARYHDDGHDFAEAMGRIAPRPWPEDDFDAWCERAGGPSLQRWGHESTPEAIRAPTAEAMGHPAGYRRVLFFLDNAGADAILGCIPLARELAREGATVTLAANTEPSLNDITIGELDAVLAELRRLDPMLGAAVTDGRLHTVASGCTTPLIDLARVSDACNEAARGTDLLILEGMGRSVESNRSTRFTCDTLWIALIKDAFVAERIGVEMFSPVWRFRPA